MDRLPDAALAAVHDRRRAARQARRIVLLRGALAAGLVIGFALWAHFGSGRPGFSPRVSPEPGWGAFRAAYGVDTFGHDGYFVRAVQNGYNLVHHTHKYAWRFTRKGALDRPNACIDCHSAESLAYAFATGDRFEARLDRRVSFEERVIRCYAGHLDGFIPTIYDPAVRDIRIFARMVAHHLQLGEGAPERAP
ncbi:hypothetical protein [Aromatoleum diolicum]|uniref:Cytochrome c domain-containing protein n=1 Tax=Aromatoleum diolicum TaxID=75796 RepID=A0ABX1QJ28_9RHOO|nr:hypothetical protein [Aromatoleum diolicum]NMG77141.1 hypothetical protein [Aromatoleum diolicum]